VTEALMIFAWAQIDDSSLPAGGVIDLFKGGGCVVCFALVRRTL